MSLPRWPVSREGARSDRLRGWGDHPEVSSGQMRLGDRSPPLFYTCNSDRVWHLTSGPASPWPQNSAGGGARATCRLPAAHLGGREDDDVLHIPPGEAGPHLQHEGYHASRQRGRGRGPRVALRAARALLQVPVGGHLGSGMGGRLQTVSSGAEQRVLETGLSGRGGPCLCESWTGGRRTGRSGPRGPDASGPQRTSGGLRKRERVCSGGPVVGEGPACTGAC